MDGSRCPRLSWGMGGRGGAIFSVGRGNDVGGFRLTPVACRIG